MDDLDGSDCPEAFPRQFVNGTNETSLGYAQTDFGKEAAAVEPLILRRKVGGSALVPLPRSKESGWVDQGNPRRTRWAKAKSTLDGPQSRLHRKTYIKYSMQFLDG